jgi:diguanylate cyclase (GGDEF)-like protein
MMLREGDVFGRIGGEEFAILLPGASVEEAFECAERIRQAVAEKPLVQDPELSVTISLGVSAQSLVMMPDEWMSAADGALYEAKRTGRNRSCIA